MTNWKCCDKKWSWPNLKYYPGICLNRLSKTIKKKNFLEQLLSQLKFGKDTS